MTDTQADILALRAAEEELAEYQLLEKQLHANRYEREFFGRKATGEDAFLQARQYEIRASIYALPSCQEKLFLNLHYLRRHSVEATGELMNVSRRTAFRLKKRAIARYAAQKREEKQSIFS